MIKYFHINIRFINMKKFSLQKGGICKHKRCEKCFCITKKLNTCRIISEDDNKIIFTTNTNIEDKELDELFKYKCPESTE